MVAMCLCTYHNILIIDYLKDLFRVTYSEEGCIKRPLEEQTWIHFCDFLDECEGIKLHRMSTNVNKINVTFCHFTAKDGKTNCAVKDILIFCSGAERLPPLGFGREPKIAFLSSEDGKLATASTCDLTLRLPTVHCEDYDSFKEWMILSIKGHDGFGGV